MGWKHVLLALGLTYAGCSAPDVRKQAYILRIAPDDPSGARRFAIGEFGREPGTGREFVETRYDFYPSKGPAPEVGRFHSVMAFDDHYEVTLGYIPFDAKPGNAKRAYLDTPRVWKPVKEARADTSLEGSLQR